MAADSVGSRLTAKAGPLPVWGWAVLIVAAYLAYTHFKGSSPAAASTSGTPASSTDTGSLAGTSGNGNAADNMNQSLLDALLQGESQSFDALTSALRNQNGYSVSGSYNTSTSNATTNYWSSTGGGTSSGPPPGGNPPYSPPPGDGDPSGTGPGAHPPAPIIEPFGNPGPIISRSPPIISTAPRPGAPVYA